MAGRIAYLGDNTGYRRRMRERVSKRIFGALCCLVGLGMAVVSGFEFYTIDSNLVLFLLGNGTVLLGVDAWKALKTEQLTRN